ncbi:protein ANTI-SILENCING 1-like isoform X1 [Carya illinoinensis]|uniref:protein ANTI-SILENCING 1-like isoform X1 n=1 Tax=Carya illinoinensis TaxID=32201 RepID=UPI001C71F57B|nr:protein ANTI-SILENCING 1-like isoform X1 [Carya illinoinensis]XP_042991840.1 protein ANTI-SILENCING 1-like isoform X1 [Carya illinoinensis]
MVEADRAEDLGFKWGKLKGRGKKGVGEKEKIVHFYQSFIYDGVEYGLYDCVYMYNEDEPEPYIGKLIKIWENPDKTKKVKVLWFFRPREIACYLGVEDTAENELFLASGEGVGLANINPLEAIAGKCNVVCTSKDSRNPQPSDEDLRTADFIFYRAFDVGRCKILDKMEEKVAGIEVKLIFNKVDVQKPNVLPKLYSDRKEVGGNALASKETEVHAKQNPSNEHISLKINGVSTDGLQRENADSNASLAKQRSSLGENPASSIGGELDETTKMNDRMENISGDRTNLESKIEENLDLKASFINKQKSSLREHPISSIGGESEISNTNSRQENISRDKTALRSEAAVKEEGQVGNNIFRIEEKLKSAHDHCELEDRPSKKAKFDSSVKVPGEKNESSVKKLTVDLDGKDAKALATITASKVKSRFELAKDLQGAEKDLSKKLKPDEKSKLSYGKLPQASPRQYTDEDKKIDHKVMDVTRRPDADKSRWFRAFPWEDRMKSAIEQGTLVLLQNLDPAYTSAEVEDIVWHAFKESCRAKMIQRTSISSPHCVIGFVGQAFAIFKTREAAEMVVKKLTKGCLLISNGRPLVGSIGSPWFPEKNPTFFGHLVIDKLRHQMPREMREAVSTSHCSQPNTIEYDMAMEWCLLQERSDLSWKKLYKQQGEELKKLKSSLKSK